MLTDLFLQLQNHLGSTLVLSLIIIPASLYFKDHELKDIFSSIKISKVLFFIYLSFLLVGTLVGRTHISVPLYHVFDHFWFTSDAAYNNQILQNIIIFIPYTLLFCLSSPSDSSSHLPATALFLSFRTSVFFECCQLIFFLGYFQFSDILWNTVGGMIGICVWIGFKAIRDRIKRL